MIGVPVWIGASASAVAAVEKTWLDAELARSKAELEHYHPRMESPTLGTATTPVADGELHGASFRFREAGNDSELRLFVYERRWFLKYRLTYAESCRAYATSRIDSLVRQLPRGPAAVTAAARVALLCAALACAGAAPSEPVSVAPPDPSRSTPTERLGYELYALDQAAWVASDAIRAAKLWSDAVRGWIVVPSAGGYLVRFVGACGEAACSYIDVQTSSAAAPPVATREEPPTPLPDEQAAMWRARDAAVRSGFRACTPRYNTVVLPEKVGDGWRVYLLATSQDADEVVLTGHHRVTVSADGRSIRTSEPLSKSCVVGKRAQGEPVVALFLTHSLAPEPIETHVFTSLNYRVTLYVGTEKGTFKVDGASIELADPR